MSSLVGTSITSERVFSRAGPASLAAVHPLTGVPVLPVLGSISLRCMRCRGSARVFRADARRYRFSTEMLSKVAAALKTRTPVAPLVYVESDRLILGVVRSSTKIFSDAPLASTRRW